MEFRVYLGCILIQFSLQNALKQSFRVSKFRFCKRLPSLDVPKRKYLIQLGTDFEMDKYNTKPMLVYLGVNTVNSINRIRVQAFQDIIPPKSTRKRGNLERIRPIFANLEYT